MLLQEVKAPPPPPPTQPGLMQLPEHPRAHPAAWAQLSPRTTAGSRWKSAQFAAKVTDPQFLPWMNPPGITTAPELMPGSEQGLLGNRNVLPDSLPLELVGFQQLLLAFAHQK